MLEKQENWFWQGVAHHEAAHAVTAYALMGGERPFEKIYVRKDFVTNPITFGNSTYPGFHGVVARPVLYQRDDLTDDALERLSSIERQSLCRLMKFDAMITLAGNTAEKEWGRRLGLHRTSLDGGFDRDAENAKNNLRDHMMVEAIPPAKRKRVLQKMVRDAISETQSLVSSHWQAIEALARELLVKSELDYSEAVVIIETH